MRARRAAAATAAVGVLLLAGACGSGDESGPEEYPSEGPEYEAAMDRCALSRLRNAGEENPTPESWAFLDARTACTYGRSFDDVSSERGWGPADPDYWEE